MSYWVSAMIDILHTMALAVFWMALALLFYVYAGYPLLLLIIASVRRRRRAALDFVPSISVLIAAYNEAGSIAKKLEQTLALDYPPDKIEIIVLSDGSTDGTDQIVSGFADPRVRLLAIPGRHGKTYAQNVGAGEAKGEVLIFSDATTVYHPMALRFLAANYADPTVGAVSGRYQYFDRDGNSPTGTGVIAFWNYENLIKRLQSRISTISGCCGCIYSVRRAAYTVLDPGIISDLVQPLWAIQKGYRVVFEDRALAYEETTRTSQEEFKMRVRVVTRGIRGLLSVPDLLNPLRYGWVSFQLVSHKIARWLVPVFLVLLLAGSLMLANTGGYRYVLAVQLAFYLFAAITAVLPLHRLWKPLGIPLFFCTLNMAALKSMLEVLRGRTYAVWETVRS